MAGMPSRLVRRVLAAGERLGRLLAAGYAQCDLNGPRADVLESVAAAGADGCSQTELAASLGASESNVSTLIERMRRDGLLLRMRSRVDRRCSVLLLTELGAQRLNSVTEGRDRHLGQWIDQLTPEEQTLLCHLLDRLLEALDQANPEKSPTQSQPAEWGQAA